MKCNEHPFVTEVASGLESLVLKNISREQGGTYECVADNGISPSDQRTFKIDIKCKLVKLVSLFTDPLDNL